MDETQRDAVIDRELARVLREAGASAAGPHLDAETAAAWTEHRLDSEAALSAELHLASCADCQALVATLVRISPEPEPDVAAIGWWRWLRRPWLVPVAAAAAAAVIWIALPTNRGTPQPESTQARAEVQRAPEIPETRPFAAPQSAAPAPSAQAARGAPAAVRVGESKAAAAATPPSAADAQADVDLVERLESAPAEPNEARGSRADAALEKQMAQPAAPSVDTRTARIAGGAATAMPPSAPRQEAAARAASPAFGDLARRELAAVANDLTIVAADGAARWRRRGAAIEFAGRADGPFTPATVPEGAADVTTGSSPGGTVCWFVGRAGLVLVTTDGLRFRRRPAPAPIDLTSVTASDARTAIVTAADGRRFRTTDGGGTWSAAP